MNVLRFAKFEPHLTLDIVFARPGGDLQQYVKSSNGTP